MSPPVLGIDFGTTKTVVAVVLDDDVEVILNGLGHTSTPSVVHINLSDPTKHLVGEAALLLAVEDPRNTIRNVKRVLGFPPEVARYVDALGHVKVIASDHGHAVCLKLENGSTITPEEVVSMLFMEAKKAAKLQLGEEVTKAVLTVPSYFTAAQRCAIKDAAFLADLEVVQVVNETTAAAAAYAYDREGSKTVLVVDVGGGGCCVSVVRVEANEVSVLVCSTRKPGGFEIDKRMVHYLKKLIKKEVRKEVSEERTIEIVRAQWDGAKAKLSRLSQTNIRTFLPELGVEFRKILTRNEVETECESLFAVITHTIEEMLKKAKVSVNEVDDVVLVGGSTRIPKLREVITKIVGPKLLKAINSDEIVARGAALLGAKCVKIKQEAFGLRTYLTVTDSESNEFPENWPNSHVLPVYFSIKCLPQGPTKQLLVKQGHDSRTTCNVYDFALPPQVDRIGINEEGFLCLDSDGLEYSSSNRIYLRGCIPEASLDILKKQIQVKKSFEEGERVQAKNALEEVLRNGKTLEILEGEILPDEHRKYGMKCRDKLEWLEANPCAGKEEFDNLRKEVEEEKKILVLKCQQEKERLHERTLLKQVLDQAVDMEVIDDEFKERSMTLKDDCVKKSVWLSEDTVANAKELSTLREYISLVMKTIFEDRKIAEIQKQRNALRDSCQQRLRGIQNFASEKLGGCDLDYQWGRELEKNCKQQTIWLSSHPDASEEELKCCLELIEKERIDIENKFVQLKCERDEHRKTAYKNAEHAALKGRNLKVSDYQLVRKVALHFVEKCKTSLEWLRNNSEKDAIDFHKMYLDIEDNFKELCRLHSAEDDRQKTKAKLKCSLESGLKQTEEPFPTYMRDCLIWLEKHPGAEKELMEKALYSADAVLKKLQEYCCHLSDAKEVKEDALKTIQTLAMEFGLRFGGPLVEPNCEETTRAECQAESGLPLVCRCIDVSPALVSIRAPPPLVLRTSDSDRAILNAIVPRGLSALESAARADSLALLVNRAAPGGGREFASLAVRYVEETVGRPVERLLVVRELGRDGEISPPGNFRQLLIEPFLDLCRQAGELDWRSSLVGVSAVGSGVQAAEALGLALGELLLEPLPEPDQLDCGAMRLDQRVVLDIREQAKHGNATAAATRLRDFFSTIDSLRALFAKGGRWFQTLQSTCRSRSLLNGADPWLNYTSACCFVTDELRRGLPQALQTVSKRDPSLGIFAEAVRCRLGLESFPAYLTTCRVLFTAVPGYQDELFSGEDEPIDSLLYALDSAFTFPEGLHLPYSRDVDGSAAVAQLCLDTTRRVLEEWRQSWTALLSLLAVIRSLLQPREPQCPPNQPTELDTHLRRDVAKFYVRFPDGLSSLQAALGWLPREEFARDFPVLHGALLKALTAPLLPPAGPRALDQLRDASLRATGCLAP